MPFGIENVARPLLVRLGYQETLEKYPQFVSKRMKFWAVLLFCFAVPSEVPGYLFGGLHYPFWKSSGQLPFLNRSMRSAQSSQGKVY